MKIAAKKPARKKPAAKPRRAPKAKANGRPSVEAWLDRIKPEQQHLVRRLDELILKAMPKAVSAVKWGVPFYGLPGQGWIAAISAFKAHVKLLLFRGRKLEPMLPEGKGHNAIDFYSDEELRQHEKQVKSWLDQAKKIPGWNVKNFP